MVAVMMARRGIQDQRGRWGGEGKKGLWAAARGTWPIYERVRGGTFVTKTEATWTIASSVRGDRIDGRARDGIWHARRQHLARHLGRRPSHAAGHCGGHRAKSRQAQHECLCAVVAPGCPPAFAARLVSACPSFIICARGYPPGSVPVPRRTPGGRAGEYRLRTVPERRHRRTVEHAAAF